VNVAAAALRVVDDDDAERLRGLLREALCRYGMHVVGEAGDGAEGVRVVEAVAPDIALVDLAMPVMDGLEVIPEIRRRSPNTRIVVLSGFEAAHMEREALARGAHAYLEKGTHPRVLVAVLHAVHEASGASLGERVKTLARTNGDMVCALSPAGTVTFVSPAARRLFGHEPQHLTEWPILDLVDQVGEEDLAATATYGEPRTVMHRLQLQAGPVVRVESVVRPIVDPGTGRLREWQLSIRRLRAS
jgi:PAS domain S-box-containing protein